MRLTDPLKLAIESFASKFQSAWFYLVFGAGAVIFVVPVIKIYLYARDLIRRINRRSAEAVYCDATREYVKLCKLLQSLGIERQPQQTGEDLIINAGANDKLPEDLQEMLRSFVATYCHERFSPHAGGKLQELSLLGAKIQDKVLTVAGTLDKQ